MTSVFRLDAETVSAEITRTRSLPQGDPAAPTIFNVTLDTRAEKFLKTAKKRGWGKQLQDRSWVSLVLFADNYWLVATSPQMLQAMTVEWLRLLGEVGWKTPTSELTWCTTTEDNVKYDITINGEVVTRSEKKKGFKVLGTLLTFDNNFDVEIENRLARAWRALHANWELLGCKSIPLTRRLQVFRSTVEASFFWCAGSWSLTMEQIRRIKGQQSRMLRKMLRIKRDMGGEHDGSHYSL